MSNYNITYTSAINGSDTTIAQQRAMSRELLANEILTAMPRVRDTLGMTMEKTLMAGKSYDFPATGYIEAGYHIPGTELLGLDTTNAQRTIAVDELMVSHRSTPKIDKWLHSFEDRQIYTAGMGEALGLLMDKHVLIEAVKGARLNTPLVTTNTDAVGTVITNNGLGLDTDGSPTAGFSTTAAGVATNWRAALKTAAENIKRKRLPMNLKPRLYIPWSLYYTLLEAVDTNGLSFFNKDFHSGSIETGHMPEIYGIEIQGTNNIERRAIIQASVSNTGTDATFFHHNADLSKTLGILMLKGAVATVKAQDITIEIEDYSVSRKAQLVTADYFVGHGWLRQEYCMEFATAGDPATQGLV